MHALDDLELDLLRHLARRVKRHRQPWIYRPVPSAARFRGSADFDAFAIALLVSPIWETPWFKNRSDWQGQTLGVAGRSRAFLPRARGSAAFLRFYDFSYDENFYTIPQPDVPATAIKNFSTRARLNSRRDPKRLLRNDCTRPGPYWDLLIRRLAFSGISGRSRRT